MECSPPSLAGRLEAAGFTLPEASLVKLARYLSLLQKWNRIMNLTGPKTWEKIADGLILDSFHLAEFLRGLPLPPAPLSWDLGAGAGLPGIPLRLLWTEGAYIMVESGTKRALFLRAALAGLELPGVRVHAGRAEEFVRDSPPADLLLGQAFLPWEKLLALAAGHMAPGGFVLIPARQARPPLPGHLAAHWKLLTEHLYSLPGEAGRKNSCFRLFQERRPYSLPPAS
jgi:16S rRNA (guanine527-N7)-methyltransferase